METELLVAIIGTAFTIVSPIVAVMFSIGARLTRIETQLRGDARRVDEILLKHDRHLHELRNSLHAISLQLAAYKSKETP